MLFLGHRKGDDHVHEEHGEVNNFRLEIHSKIPRGLCPVSDPENLKNLRGSRKKFFLWY